MIKNRQSTPSELRKILDREDLGQTVRQWQAQVMKENLKLLRLMLKNHLNLSKEFQLKLSQKQQLLVKLVQLDEQVQYLAT